MKSLGVFPPVKNPTASLDLLNLYMVNQIASKKKTPGKILEGLYFCLHVVIHNNVSSLIG